MTRTFLVAGVAIAALFGGSAALILALTSPPPSASSEDGSVARVEASAPAPAAAPIAAAPAAPSRPPGAGPVTARARDANTRDPLQADRVVRKIVRKALLAGPVQSRLARCADPAGGFGGPEAAGRVSRGAPAVVVLDMEALGGELRIVDAHVKTWGGASAAAASCASDVLRGQVIPAAKVERGRRMHMSFPLNRERK